MNISKIINILQSTTFTTTLSVFVMVLIVTTILIIILNGKSQSQTFGRINHLRGFQDDEVFKQFREKNKYTDTFEKYINPYVQNNPEKFDKLLNIFGVDLNILQKKIARANVNNITPIEMATLKLIGVFAGIIIAINAILFSNYMFLGVALIVFGYLYFVPEAKLDEKYKKRKYEIIKVLPYYLNLLANATEVGNTIGEAIKTVRERFPCLLSVEFKKAEEAAKYDNDWSRSLYNMAFKNDIDLLTAVVDEVNIAKEKGTEIAEVLRRHSKKLEYEVSQEMTEKARKKATTMLLPIFIFLLVPVILLLLLPAMSNIITGF
ncbi:MAG: type II secretion system F family protein [Candidatus Woesearchaeota archaeon]